MNMGLYEAAQQIVVEMGFDLGAILEREGDPRLGNGGLGRLAACFMAALATLELPAIGYGTSYDFGMFEQRIDDGQQVERHDNWLHLGNAWKLPRHEDGQAVRFYGRVVFVTTSRGGCAPAGSTRLFPSTDRAGPVLRARRAVHSASAARDSADAWPVVHR